MESPLCMISCRIRSRTRTFPIVDTVSTIHRFESFQARGRDLTAPTRRPWPTWKTTQPGSCEGEFSQRGPRALSEDRNGESETPTAALAKPHSWRLQLKKTRGSGRPDFPTASAHGVVVNWVQNDGNFSPSIGYHKKILETPILNVRESPAARSWTRLNVCHGQQVQAGEEEPFRSEITAKNVHRRIPP